MTHGHLTVLYNLEGQRRKMRVLLRSRWVGWTNEWAYCWGLPRCHGAGSQWTAHPNILTNGITCMSHTPQVLTGTGPWHVSVCLEDHSPPPSAKPLRQQLKEAFKNGHTLTSQKHSLSPFVSFLKAQWAADTSDVTVLSWPNHTHMIESIFLLLHTS